MIFFDDSVPWLGRRAATSDAEYIQIQEEAFERLGALIDKSIIEILATLKIDLEEFNESTKTHMDERNEKLLMIHTSLPQQFW